MSITGLDVKGLDTTEISRKLEVFVADYFKGYSLGAGQSMFQEGFMLEFGELMDTIPLQHHHLFNDDTEFVCMSGFITVGYVDGKADERIISLIMDEHSEYAYLLCLLQEVDGEGETVIIKDFLSA